MPLYELLQQISKYGSILWNWYRPADHSCIWMKSKTIFGLPVKLQNGNNCFQWIDCLFALAIQQNGCAPSVCISTEHYVGSYPVCPIVVTKWINCLTPQQVLTWDPLVNFSGKWQSTALWMITTSDLFGSYVVPWFHGHGYQSPAPVQWVLATAQHAIST